ncbi:protein of unknown function [Candidatus Nitrosotalea okcheonensis]|uniref:Uncharacterized protein n=1 Tax=Candidatus Nitrosotalea okcheonensis TaxID=1903276 RepID=A0A2H1FHR5_9ARCH|nr:protein of unknown function [Candidatus Nitrosotalea okcheonensis]
MRSYHQEIFLVGLDTSEKNSMRNTAFYFKIGKKRLENNCMRIEHDFKPNPQIINRLSKK